MKRLLTAGLALASATLLIRSAITPATAVADAPPPTLLMSAETEAEAEVSRWREPLTPPPIRPEDADPETRALLLHDTGGALLDRLGAP
jgi:hypothetical protein